MSDREKKERRRRAKLGSILVYVDEPQLVVLDCPGSAKIVAVAIDDDCCDMSFLGAEIGETQWVRYLREQVDLRYLFQYPRFKRWYKFNYNELLPDGILLNPITLTAEREDAWFPDAGFFSRHHTEVNHGKSTSSTQEFDVDGAWDLHEFSTFYARMSDVYAFHSAAINWSDPEVDFETKRKTKLAFIHSYNGGSSYVNFFNELYAAQPYEDQIAVHSIQYASPGAIKVDGNAVVFQAVKAALADYAQVRGQVKSTYDRLYKYMSERGFLRVGGAKSIPTDDEQKVILKDARMLASDMKFDQFPFVYEVCDKNSIITAKVMLAVSRRMESLFSFFAEGRAKLPQEEIRV